MVSTSDRNLSLPALVTHISALLGSGSPLIVGIDGRSGVGKSTLARHLAEALGGRIVEGDAFFAGGTNIHPGSPAVRAEACIDRPKLAGVLCHLRQGRAARYRPFDWEAFDGSLDPVPVLVSSGPLCLVEGVYACHPDVHACLDLKVLAHTAPRVREARLLAREGRIGPWERQWHEAEDWYFSAVMPSTGFDLLVDTAV